MLCEWREGENLDSLRVAKLNIRKLRIEDQIASDGYVYFRTKETQLDHVTRNLV